MHTERLLLRPWSATDAPALLPLLTANVAHIGPWIPPRVSTPVPLTELAERLAGFAEDFTADRAFRYALLSRDGTQLFGEVDLFPRGTTGRVPLGAADHVELGYWLDAASTGKGLASEACRALMSVAESLPVITHVDIRCDATNQKSAAVPRRLGFHLAFVEGTTHVWRSQVAHIKAVMRDVRGGDGP